MFLEDDVRGAINDALNNMDGPFKLVKCPRCGHEMSHVYMRSLKEEDTGTRQGGYLLEFEYECGCPSSAFIVAEHKGQCVFGRVKEKHKNVTYEVEEGYERTNARA